MAYYKVTIVAPLSNHTDVFTVEASSEFEAKEKARHSQSIYRDVKVTGDVLRVVKVSEYD